MLFYTAHGIFHEDVFPHASRQRKAENPLSTDRTISRLPSQDLVPALDDPHADSVLAPLVPKRWRLAPPEPAQYCGVTYDCGLALTCKSNKCSECVADKDCLARESCALGHCVRRENVECSEDSQCAHDSSCVLNHYSAGPRGNETMIAYCASHLGPSRFPSPSATAAAPALAPSPDLFDGMYERLEAFKDE